MTRSITRPIVSPKQASRIVLVPNREILQRRIAEKFTGRPEGDVIPAPPVFMLSSWVEESAVTLRQLSGDEVPRTQDAIGGLLEWWRCDTEGAGEAFSLNAARQARSADRLLCQWQEGEGSQWVADSFFARRKHVRDSMEKGRMFSAEDWLIDLTQRLRATGDLPLALPEAVTLEGFVEFTPLERGLLEAMESRGVRVAHGASEEPTDDGAAEIVVTPLETPEDEWREAARWARQQSERGLDSVCVVVPAGVTSAGAESRRLRQAFKAAFPAGETDRRDDAGNGDYFIPSAERLSACRPVIDAFLLLRLAAGGPHAPQPFPALSQWLLSPHWADADKEREARARLELKLRHRGLYRLAPVDVVRLARAEKLADSLPSLFERVAAMEAPPSTSIRGSALHAALQHWGWPGPVRGRAIAQQVERLHGLLERIADLRLQNFDEAMRLLAAACEDILVPLGGGPLSPVQVLTPEVAAAGRFDALWLCHADDVSWPPPIAVNPFVPAGARHAIPRMNPEGQSDYYRTLTRMLCSAAPQVHISWSRDAGQGERSLSGLVADLPGLRTGDSGGTDGSVPQEAPLFDMVEDDVGVAFAGEGEIELAGGANFFNLQAACPLMAYARYRLRAEFPPMPGPMPDPAFRGIVLHRALRILYEGGGDPRGVPAAKGIAKAVEAVLSEPRIRARLTPTGLRAEEGRLRRALASWLQLDGSRDGFIVDALEAPQQLHLGRAVIQTRFDRLDRLDDGRVFLVDYKSGKAQKARSNKWLRDRIQEVQLPLYAVGYEAAGLGQVGGLALASVRPGDCGLVGISDHDASTAGDVDVAGKGRGKARQWRWVDLVNHWRAQAELLCEEILAGRADNRVYDRDALRYTDLSLILRHDDGFELNEEDEVHVG